MSDWKTILDVVTALVQAMLNLSLGPDIHMVHRRKSIGEMPALPQVSMLVNCHLWMCYGILHDSIFPVAVSQGFGQLAAVVFNLIYFYWSPPQASKDTFKLYIAALVLHCVVTLYFVLSVTGVIGRSNYDSSILLGYFGVVINVCMFASPFSTLKHVVQTKSSAPIPINLSFMIVASSALWVATGLLDSDYFIAGLNLAGVVMGAIQMALYYIYRPGRPLFDQQYGMDGELPVAVSPTPKNTGVVVFTESPVSYKSVLSPAVGHLS